MVFTNFVGQYSFFKNCANNRNLRHAIFRRCKNIKYFSRNFSAKIETSSEAPFVPFLENIKTRREEASRSILVEIQSEQCLLNLHTYCGKLGNVNKFIHCVKPSSPTHLVIVEFNNSSNVNEILNSASFDSSFPVQSPFLIYKSSSKKKSKKIQFNEAEEILNNAKIKGMLNSCKNVSEQMTVLHNAYKLNDFGTRLRFLVARQIETSITGMFPNATAYLFGSSVNGYGKIGCDLDIVLRFSNDDKIGETNKFIALSKEISKEQQRSFSEKRLEVLAGILQLFLPGCAVTMRIPKARIPIIKYIHNFADINCDISMSNMSGVHMSDLLYMYGSMDPRVRPLVFAVRQWAKQVGLTHENPGSWITNFSLTLLVLAFLQNRSFSPPVLPPFNMLIQNARAQDVFQTEDNINCTFLRDIQDLNFRTTNREDLETLLVQFFEFYASTFNFKDKALDLNIGIPILKPDSSPLYILNPLERHLNVAKNVSSEQLSKFKVEAYNAANLLLSENRNSFFNLKESKQKSNNSDSKFNVFTLFEKDVAVVNK